MKQVLILIFLSFIASKSWADFLPKTFEADFEQVTKTLRSEKKSPVKVFYKFQSNIFFEVTGDTPITYVCNKDNVWIYNPPFIEGEPGELKVGDSSKYCYSKLFDTLSKGLESNKLYDVKAIDKEAILTFSQQVANQLSIEKVKIILNKSVHSSATLNDVSSMHIYKLNENNPVILNLKLLKSDISIQDKKFIFIPPENTNIKTIK